MTRIVTVLLLAACFAAVAASQTLASGAATGPARIRITDREVELTRVDVGRRGRSPGDMELVTTVLYNRRITQRPIGHAEFVCTFVRGISRNCRGTIFLPRGKLVVGGPVRFWQFFELAVLGGTGLYDNARGVFTSTRIGKSPRRDFLLVRLTG